MVDLKEEAMKSCTGCSTTITPLWRGGPAGPKTLCNACGIKYHKKRRALLGEQKKEKPRKKKIKMKNGGDDDEMRYESASVRVPVKIKMVMKKYNRKFGEVEQAALLLMALSYGGCVYS